MSKKDDWLKERRNYVTASDAAAILGLDHWRGPLDVFADKRGLIEREDTDAALFGRLLEDDVAQGYEIKTGRKVIAQPEYTLAKSSTIPWLAATLDRKTRESSLAPCPLETLPKVAVPLELKAPGERAGHGWDEEPPLSYQVQVQIQMEVTESQWASIGALIGGQLFKWADLTRNQSFLDAALPKLEEFWIRVKNNDPPPPSHRVDHRTLSVLYAQDNGETIELGEDVLQHVRAWAILKERKKAAEDELEEREAEILAALGANQVAILPDGSILTGKTQKISEATIVRKAHTRKPLYWKRGKRR